MATGSQGRNFKMYQSKVVLADLPKGKSAIQGKPKTLKKGDAKALSISHPNSRKAKSFAKKIIKASTREKTKTESAIKRNILHGEKLVWFQEHLEPGSEYTAPMLDSLFEKYLKRFDDELEQIAIKHSIGQRKNRQHANREDIINLTKKREYEEYNTCGIEMVDILNSKQLKLFREWDGNLGVHFKIRRFSKSFLTKHQSKSEEMAVEDDCKTENVTSDNQENIRNSPNENKENVESDTDTSSGNKDTSGKDDAKSSMDIEESVT